MRPFSFQQETPPRPNEPFTLEDRRCHNLLCVFAVALAKRSSRARIPTVTVGHHQWSIVIDRLIEDGDMKYPSGCVVPSLVEDSGFVLARSEVLFNEHRRSMRIVRMTWEFLENIDPELYRNAQ